MIERLVGFELLDPFSDIQQPASQRHGLLVRRTGQQAVMPDAVEAARQDMHQEAADKLIRRQRDYLLAFGPVATVILVAERHTVLAKGEEPPVRDGDAVGVAREIGQHRLRPGEGRPFDWPARQALRRALA